MFVHRQNGEIVGCGANPQTNRDPEIADKDNPDWVIYEAKLNNYSTASKLDIIDYFISINRFTDLMTVIEQDEIRKQRWLACQNVSINDPMMPAVCEAMEFTPQQLQDLFNYLNRETEDSDEV